MLYWDLRLFIKMSNLETLDFLRVSLAVPASLMIAFLGLLFGAELAPYFASNTFIPVFAIPLILNVSIGYFLMRNKRSATSGHVILVGGVIASIALPFILL